MHSWNWDFHRNHKNQFRKKLQTSLYFYTTYEYTLVKCLGYYTYIFQTTSKSVGRSCFIENNFNKLQGFGHRHPLLWSFAYKLKRNAEKRLFVWQNFLIHEFTFLFITHANAMPTNTKVAQFIRSGRSAHHGSKRAQLGK